jgi:PAS domain S-box-containing protein
MGSGGDKAVISVICDAEGTVVLQTGHATAQPDGAPDGAADAWTSEAGHKSVVGTPLVKTFWFDHLDVDHKELHQIIRRAASAGKPDRVRIWIRVDKHQLIRVELTAMPLVDASGTAKQVLVRTEPTRADPRRKDAPDERIKRVRTIDAAGDEAAPLQTGLDLLAVRLSVPMVRLELASATVLAGNEAFAALIGRSQADCANLPLSELLHADDRRAATEAFAGRSASSPPERPIDVRLQSTTGEREVRLTPTADPTASGAIVLVITDRSDAARASALASTNAQLVEASTHHARWLARLDKLIDHSPVGLALFENGQPIRTNPAFERQIADSGAWVDALTHRAARTRSTAEQLSTKQAITGYWLADSTADDDSTLVGATIAPAPQPAIEAERRLDATLAAMVQSERLAAAVIETGGEVLPLGPALARLVGEGAINTIDSLIAAASIGELRSALAQVRSSQSTASVRVVLRNNATCDVTLAALEGGQGVLAIFEDATELSTQLESLRGRLAAQHETIERLELATAEAAEARQLRARDVERQTQSKRLFDAFAGGTLSWDVDEGKVQADARARQLLGCDPSGDLTPATLLAAARSDDQDRFERALFDAMSSDGDGGFDATVHVGPEAAPVRIVGSVLFDERDGSRDPSRFVGGAVDISDVRRTETQVAELASLLQLRTAELNAIFECAPDALRITTHGTMRHNAAAASLFAEHIDAMFNGDGTAPPALAMSGRPAAAIVSIDGDKLVLSSAAPVVSGGEVVGAVSVDRDVTDQRQLEAELHNRDEQIEGLFQNTGVGLAYLNPDGVILDANPQLSVLLGYSRSDLTGKPIGDLSIDTDRATLAGQLEAVLSGELTSCSSEVRLLRRGGEPRWVQLTIAPRHGSGDRSVVAIVQDMHELRVERERRTEASATLATMRERYDLLASTIGEGFVLIDDRGRIVEANAAARKLLALPADRADVPAFDHLAFASPDTGTAVTQKLPWQRAARGKATTAELVVSGSDGGVVRTIEFVASPAPQRQVAINARDVTSRHAMQEDLQKAYARVVEAHTLLQQRTQQWEGNFVSAVNQLGAATASAAPMAKAIAGDTRLPSDLRTAAQRMVDAFRVHDRLVKHYADVPGTAAGGGTRVHAPPGRPAPTMREDVDVQHLADEALRLVAARYNVVGRLTAKLAATSTMCHLDAALIRHALWSVFAHAAAHASKAAARIETTDARSDSGEPRLRLTVAWQGRSSRAAELSLATSLVESEGGTLTVESAGDGTVATIEFASITASTSGDTKRADALIRARVLLVEDHDSTARVLSRQLARLRCDVTLATTIAEAEDKLASGGTAIDLVVCDLTMPDGSAAEFVSRLNAARAASKKPALPAIALRGYGGDHDAKALKAAGFVDQLIKPVDLNALATAIGKISTSTKGVAFARDAIA